MTKNLLLYLMYTNLQNGICKLKLLKLNCNLNLLHEDTKTNLEQMHS